MILAALKIFFSIYLMWKVSSSFDLAANYLTRNLGDGIKGPTVNAVASSLPELLISTLFLFFYKDIEGFSAGFATIVGSSAFNIALIPAIAYFFAKRRNKELRFSIDGNIVKQDGLFLLISIFLLGVGLFVGLNIYYASILIFTYSIYVFYIYKMRNSVPLEKNKNFDEKFSKGTKYNLITSLYNLRIFNIIGVKKINNFNSSIVLIISVIIISIACFTLVNVVEEISKRFEVNLFIIAFFIAAISSSIPDTILSIKDAQHNKFNDSFSNTYGSNIFDICIGIGLPVFIYSIFYPPISVIEAPAYRLGLTQMGDNIFSGNILIWSVLILFILTALITFIYRKGVINSKNIIYILFIYFLYIFSLLIF